MTLRGMGKFVVALLGLLTGVQLAHSQCTADAGDPVTICQGESVELGGSPTAINAGPGVNYTWNNGAASVANPTVTPSSTTTYTVTLNGGGCNNVTDQVTVTVLPSPNANFTFAPNTGCAGTPFTFTNTTTGCPGCEYNWNFDNPASGANNTSSSASPSHTFVSVGGGTEVFTVTLTVESSNGCTDTYSQNITINQQPDAVLTEDANFTQCLGVSTFYAYVTDASTPASASNYTINWGDGSPNYSSSTPPSALEHIYGSVGIWTLTYTVTSSNGCSDSQTYQVSNISNPAIGAANPGNTLQCGPVEFCFPLSNYSNNHESTIYVVDFGDGSPTQTFNHPPPASVCHTYSTSTCQNTPQFFTFAITADNACTASQATISPIQIFMPPQASFTNPAQACVNSAVPFTNTTIPGYNLNCSTSTSYTWNFGDPASGANNTSTAVSPTHVYASPGTYTITMTATNGGNPLLACGTTTWTSQVCIEQPPSPVFTVNDNDGCLPMAVTTDNTTSTSFASCNTSTTWQVNYSDLPCDPDNGTYSFTNGTSASSLEPQFLFSSVGVYTLVLQMTNSCGTFTDSEQITVNTVPVVAINPVGTVCSGTSVTPSAVVDNCNLPITSYLWSFTNGAPTSSTALNPGPVSYANPGNYPISLTATNACGPSTANTTVSVLAPPDVLVDSSSPTDEVCANGSVTLTASGAGSYVWSPGTGLSATSGQSVTASPSVTTTYTVTGTSGSCTDTGTITVTVVPVPQVTPAGVFEMCVGQAEQLNVNVAGGEAPYSNYVWNNAATLNNSGIPNPISTAGSSLTYTVTVTDNNGCVGSGQVPLTVNPLPVVNAGPDIQLCNQPVATQLTGYSPTVGGVGTWSGPNVTPGGMFTPNTLGPVNLQYCFTSSSTGCSACDQMTVTVVNPTPADAGPDTTACLNGAPLILPAGGTWTGSPQVSAGGTFTPTALGPVNLTFTVGNGSCQTTDQVTVTVLPIPTANAGADQTVCAGTQVQLSASGSSPNSPLAGFFWSGGTVSNPLISNPTATPPANTTFNVTVVDDFGCSAQDQVTIFVNPLPVVNAGLDIQLCNQPIATQLAAGSPAGGTWSGPGVTPGGSFTPSGVGPAVLTYTYTNPVTNCTSSDQLTVDVINAVVANAGPDIDLCQGGPVYQVVPPVAGGTWSPVPITANGQFTPSTAGVFNFTYSIGSGTCLTQDQMTITVNALPTVDAGPAQVICVGDTAQLNSTTNGGQVPYSYSWNFPATLSSNAIADPEAWPAVTTNYTLTVTDDNQCSATDQVLITVNTLPVVFAGNDLTLCDQPIQEQLTGFSPTIGGVGEWSGPGIVDPDGVFLSPGVGSYWIYYTFTAGGNNCSNVDSIQVTVNVPVIANAGPDVTLCLNDGLYTFGGINPVAGGTWTGTGIADSNQPVFNPEDAGAGTYTITLSYGSGTCLSTDDTEVEVLPLPVVEAGPDQTLCGNAEIFDQEGYTPATGGTWEGPGITNATLGTFDPGAGPGNYDIFYWYTDPNTGCSDTSYKAINISPVPVANFTVPAQGCTNSVTDLTNTSVGANTYEWNFGNGAVMNGFEPNYTYPDEGIFDITLIASNNFGCQDTAINANEIVDPPAAAFVLLPADGCAPLTVSFENNSVGQYLSWDWDLAITSTTAQVPADVVYQQGPDVLTYPISLTATNYCGSSTANDIVTVYPQPVAGFGTDLDVFCSPFTVNFNNTSTGNPDTYLWDFGDGGPTSSLQEPLNHVFFADTIPVNYTIWLYLSNECGEDSAEYTITVLPNTVTAFFNTNVTEGCSPLEVEFTDYSDGGDQIQYEFGDGTFTGNPNPTHVFDDAGEYTVYQYVDNGCSYDTTQITIVVFESPEVDFTTDVPFICENNPVQFDADPGTSVSVTWDFGDGGTSYLSDPEYTYEIGGNYVVTMTGENDNGCTTTVSHPFNVYSAPEAEFTVPDQVGCSPFTLCVANATNGGVFYEWDFGDGNTANGNNPCNTYTNVGAEPALYTVSLIAENMQLCADTFQMNIIVSPQPSSAFALGSFESCYFPVEVTATNFSLDANGYGWYVNGELVSDLTNTVLIFGEVGTYEVELEASNQYGCTSTSSTEYTVHPLPEASFSADPQDGCVDLTVNFTNTSNGAASYVWHFGDGATSVADNPSHIYDDPGLYDVALVVTTDQGCQDTLEYEDYVEAYNLPVADFFFDPEETTIYSPTFTFFDDSWDAVAWEWDFGDGATASVPNIIHYYDEAGIWPVTLTVYNEHGCSDTKADEVIIQDIFNIYVPNTFTPDGDELNEVFLPEMSGKDFIDYYTFRIFDRWGTVIFETNDPDMPWVGDVREGDYYAKDEVYNWQIIVRLKGSDEERVYFGHVNMLR